MAWNKLVQRSFVMEHHLFFERVRHEDDVWNWEMAKHVQKIAVCKHDTYVYMIHDGGIMSELERDLPRMYLGRIAMLKYFVNHITDPFRKRQISCIRNYIQIVFPNNDDIEYKDELQYIYTRLIKESKGSQKMALWLYYSFRPILSIFRPYVPTFI